MSLSMRSYVNRRTINKDVQFNTRLTQFLSPPIHTGDLNVINDLTVGGNTYLNNLTVNRDFKVLGNTSLQQVDISQNLMVIGNTSLQRLDVSGNLTVVEDAFLKSLDVLENVDVSGNIRVQNNLFAYGSILAAQYLPGQVVNMIMLNNTELGQQSKVINAGATINIFNYTYTPKITNSYLLIEYQTKYDLSGSNTDEMWGYLKVDVGGTSVRISETCQRWINGAGGGTRSGTIFPIVGRYTNTDTNNKFIMVDVYNNTDSDPVSVSSSISSWLKITEIGR